MKIPPFFVIKRSSSEDKGLVFTRFTSLVDIRLLLKLSFKNIFYAKTLIERLNCNEVFLAYSSPEFLKYMLQI